ncbi:FAD-dependent oxidoreductase [Pelomyxa schiedti]|nr:FAD-dependent oxidoreductase [Pelomyxa schiedti]
MGAWWDLVLLLGSSGLALILLAKLFSRWFVSSHSLFMEHSNTRESKASSSATATSNESKLWDVIVVGSGVSGLAAASVLSRAGKRVLILEQHHSPGGSMYVFKRGPYSFEVGLHCLDGSMLRGDDLKSFIMHTLCENKVQYEWHNATLGSFYSLDPSGKVTNEIHNPLEGDARERYLKEKFPTESAAITKHFTLVRSIGSIAGSELVLRSALNEFPFLLRALLKIKWAIFGSTLTSTTWKQYCTDLTSNVQLRHILGLSSCNVLATCPSEMPANAGLAMTWGTFTRSYPIGGGPAIASAMLEGIRNRGGAIKTSCKVTKFLFSGSKCTGVETKSGEQYSADCVISTIGFANTASMGAGKFMSYVPKSEEYGIGYSCCFVGLDDNWNNLGLSPTMCVLPNKDVFTAKLDTPFNLPEKRPDDVRELFDYMPLGFYCTEAKLASNSNFTSLVGIVMTPYSWFAEWEETKFRSRPAEYLKFKSQLGDAMIERLIAARPQCKDHLKHVEFGTPLSTLHWLGKDPGASYAMRLNFDWAKNHKPQCRLAHCTGLLVAGEQVEFGGVPGALICGVNAAGCALNKCTFLDAVLGLKRKKQTH